MGWFILKHIFTTLFSFINIRRLSDQEKDLEILILRQQLSILQRKHKHPIKPSRVEKQTLGVLATKFKRTTHQTANQLRGVSSISFSLKPCCAGKASPALSGIGNWFVGNGPIQTKTRVDDHQSVRKLKASFSVSLERTPAWVMARLWVNSSNWASRSP